MRREHVAMQRLLDLWLVQRKSEHAEVVLNLSPEGPDVGHRVDRSPAV